MARWLSMSTQFLTDPEIEAIGETYGATGPLLIFALLARAKVAAEGGKVSCSFRTLAHESFGETDQVKPIIEAASAADLLEVVEMGDTKATVFFPKFLKWQDAGRKARDREMSGPVRTESEKIPTDKQTDKQRKKRASDEPPPVREIFDAWVEAAGKNPNQVKFSSDRQKLIARRLKEWPADDLLDAVRGWRHSPHHRGENDRGTVYNDLDLLLRNAKNIEKFRDLERAAKSKPRSRSSMPEGFIP